MKKIGPILLIFLLSALFFWKFLILGHIPIDSTALYQMRPWSTLPEKPVDFSASDPARYYHNIDPIVEVYPIKQWLAKQLRSGDVPLWIHSLFSGSPFAANHHAAPWDFSSLFFFALPTDIAFGVILLLHLFIAGACMYFCCRVLDLSIAGSLLGSTGFMFNSFFLHWLGLISFNAGLIWMPLVPAGIELAFRRNSITYFAISAAALGFAFLSGMAQFWLFNLFLFFAYGLYKIAAARFANLKFGVAGLIIAVALAAGFGAVQLFQTSAALSSTSRGGDAQASVYEGRNHLSPRRLPTLLIPDLYGHHEENAFSKLLLKSSDPEARGIVRKLIWGEKGSVFHRAWGYIGFIPFLLMLIGMLQARSSFSFYRVLALSVIAFQILLCWQPFHDLCAKVWPGFDTLDHTRTIVLYAFAASILAALGLDSLESWREKTRLLTILPAATIALLAASIFLLGFFANHPVFNQLVHFEAGSPKYSPDFFRDAAPKIQQGIRDSRTILFAPTLILVAALAGIRFWVRNNITTANFCMFLLLISAIDLIYRGWTDPPLEYTEKKWIYPRVSKVAEFLQHDPETFRVYELHRKLPLPKLPLRKYSELELLRKGSVRFFDFRSVEFVFRPNSLLLQGIESAGGYMSLYPGRYKELWSGRGMDVLKALQETQQVEQWDTPWVGMQNVKYLLVPDDTPSGNWTPAFQAEGIKVLKLTSFLPRYYGVPSARMIKDPTRLLAEIKSPSFDPSREVLLEDDFESSGSTQNFKAVIQLTSQTADEIRLNADFSGDGFLVVTDNYFPGWRCSVDGKSVEILRANYAFKALPLNRGRHEIVMEFDPGYYKISILCSVIAGGLIAALLLRIRRTTIPAR
jgi:hypothetical protein